MDSEISSLAMQRLLGVNKVSLADLAKRGVVIRGKKRGSYYLQASVNGYCQHLRDMAAGRGGEAGATARLGAAQTDLTETNAKAETFGRTKLKAFCSRVLAIPHGVEYLSARQTLALTQELRACLDELADGKGA
jgi:phage terminase Nu1 subunit (DNA packaging protein)